MTINIYPHKYFCNPTVNTYKITCYKNMVKTSDNPEEESSRLVSLGGLKPDTLQKRATAMDQLEMKNEKYNILK